MSAELRSEEGPSGHAGVLGRLRHLILIGEYGPDERLVEEQLAKRLGVSRTPVRQALAMLEAEGLVGISPNRGATVCSFGLDDVWDVYDLRAVLEGHAARRAASRIEEPELERLREVVAEVYGEEALAGREAALWLAAESLAVEHGGELLSRYEVDVETATGRLRAVTRPRLFGTSRALSQPRLFRLDALWRS